MLEKVIEILAEQLSVEVEEINKDSNIIKDLDADSLDIMDIVSEIEDEFEIEVDDADIEKLSTPAEIVAYIEANK